MLQTKRALVVIDVQNEYITGNFLIEYPPVSQSLNNIEKIIKLAKEQNIPVVAIQHTAPENSPIFAKNSINWQLHSTVMNQQPDKIIQKTKANCFAKTDLKDWLDQQDINTLTIIGYMTHNCDISTAIEAEEMGYEIEFISDAAGSLSYVNEVGKASAEELHRCFSVVVQSNFGAVMTTAEWLTMQIDKSKAVRSNIYLSNQQAKAK